jgi:hypothetical protein
MFKIIENDKYKYEIFLEQIQSWWGNKITNETLNMFIKIYMNHLNNDKYINEIVRTVKELFVKSVSNQNELSLLIDKYLIPQDIEKKKNAEVSTPYKLRNEMLDKIPIEFWTTPQKVFEPCSGKGGFLIDIINRFMTGLKDLYPDEKERYKFIIEECLYWCDINPTNIFICKLLIDPYNEYKINYHEGNTLELDVKDKWGLEGFDGVIGNPPYQNNQNSTGKRGGGDLLWNKFVKKSLKKWVLQNGYLLYIHPAGWRKPPADKSKYIGLFNLMCKDNQMIYLEIHNTADGQKVFKCGTRYDWYLIKKIKSHTTTEIVDEKNLTHYINLNNWNFLPNYNINKLNCILALDGEEKCNIIFNRSNYGSDKKYVKPEKDEEHIYKLIHSTPKKGIRYMYSSTNEKGHFGIPKVIFGETGINNAIIDIDGCYGMTQQSMAISDSINTLGNIKCALESTQFGDIISSCSWSNYRIDWRLFKYIKKDFWKDFI